LLREAIFFTEPAPGELRIATIGGHRTKGFGAMASIFSVFRRKRRELATVASASYHRIGGWRRGPVRLRLELPEIQHAARACCRHGPCRKRSARDDYTAMQHSFDFDLFSRLAQEDPAAFEAQRRLLFEEAFAQMPAQHQSAARSRLAEVQVRMAAAPSPAARLAVAVSAMGDSLSALQRNMLMLRDELEPVAVQG
jgi:hypothetical protein